MGDIFTFDTEIKKDAQVSLLLYVQSLTSCSFHSVLKMRQQVKNLMIFRVEKDQARKTNLLRYKKAKLHVHLLDQTKL